MAGRRSQGEGSVYRQGDKWIAMLELPRGRDGKRRRALRRRRTKAEATRALKQMQDEVRQVGLVADVRRTVNAAVDAYQTGNQSSPNDEWMLGMIRSALGRRRLASLTVADCDQFLIDCADGKYGDRPIGRTHIRRVRQRLVAVIRNEVRLGTLSGNVAEVSEIPVVEVSTRSRRALSTSELRTVLDRADGVTAVLVDLCGRNGLRPAEARALRWVDVDLERQLLSITGQIDRNNERGPVKRAANAERTLQFDTTTAQRLNRWRTQANQLQERAGRRWNNTGYVAVTSAGQPISREWFAILIRRLRETIELDQRITPYELRHTAISHQADQGHSSFAIADWAGTSEAMISSRYRHRLRQVAALRPVELGDRQSEALNPENPR